MFRPLIISLLMCFVSLSWAERADNFSEAKRQAWQIYADNQKDFYCGCDYKQGDVDARACGYKARKNATRGGRIEWEHVVPAWEFGHQRQCWQKGGREYCEKNDKQFNVMESDLHNLVPAVGELNADRSNFQYGMLEGEPRVYGKCDFEVDFKGKTAEPPANRQGDVARIYFYMRDTYKLTLSKQKTQLFEAWAKMDPVDMWELERDKRIQKVQGNSNCYVTGKCGGAAADTPVTTESVAQPRCNPEVKYCKQMSSCDEARFYLNSCGLKALDRDGDGVPCESLCK
jgi:deoxyribonuclease I